MSQEMAQEMTRAEGYQVLEALVSWMNVCVRRYGATRVIYNRRSEETERLRDDAWFAMYEGEDQ